MNLIAMIGTIDQINSIDNDLTNIHLKVEKPFMMESDPNDIYDVIEIKLLNKIFKRELKFLSKGNILGLKGRIKSENGNLSVFADKIQLF